MDANQQATKRSTAKNGQKAESPALAPKGRATKWPFRAANEPRCPVEERGFVQGEETPAAHFEQTAVLRVTSQKAVANGNVYCDAERLSACLVRILWWMRTSASATHVSSGFEALPEVGEVGFETALDYVFASAFLLVFVLRPTGGR